MNDELSVWFLLKNEEIVIEKYQISALLVIKILCLDRIVVIEKQMILFILKIIL